MSGRVDLILLGGAPPGICWPLGEIRECAPTPAGAAECTETAPSIRPEAWLFWDPQLALPRLEEIERLLASPGDVWHAGLKLGTGGLPMIIDFIHPTWMLNSDPDPEVEATSWRLSLRACLVRDSVVKQLGGVSATFETLDAAGLELGHRYITAGAIVRHRPDLIGEINGARSIRIRLFDEFLFARHRFSKRWMRWALARMITSRTVPPRDALRAWRLANRTAVPPTPQPFRRDPERAGLPSELPAVSVILPTVDRYPYLRTLLDQLRRQTVPPHEIIIVDQTAADARDRTIEDDFSDLPLVVIYQDRPGQCTSRNEAILRSTGEYLLFIDDDDEVPDTLIEDHLETLNTLQADVSSGIAEEIGALPLPDNFRYQRASDVFPTNNSMLRRRALQRTGLFDLAYDRGQRADGDLGTRLYRSGALMIFEPSISVFHHHAPSGGLRTHKARIITYGSSRQKLMHRQLKSTTELYMGHRYFSERQRREALWINVLGTYSMRGNAAAKAIKSLIGILCLPHTLWVLRQRSLVADHMRDDYPQIPSLDAASVSRARRTLPLDA